MPRVLCISEKSLGEIVKKNTGKSPSEIIYEQIHSGSEAIAFNRNISKRGWPMI